MGCDVVFEMVRWVAIVEMTEMFAERCYIHFGLYISRQWFGDKS